MWSLSCPSLYFPRSNQPSLTPPLKYLLAFSLVTTPIVTTLVPGQPSHLDFFKPVYLHQPLNFFFDLSVVFLQSSSHRVERIIFLSTNMHSFAWSPSTLSHCSYNTCPWLIKKPIIVWPLLASQQSFSPHTPTLIHTRSLEFRGSLNAQCFL